MPHKTLMRRASADSSSSVGDSSKPFVLLGEEPPTLKPRFNQHRRNSSLSLCSMSTSSSSDMSVADDPTSLGWVETTKDLSDDEGQEEEEESTDWMSTSSSSNLTQNSNFSSFSSCSSASSSSSLPSKTPKHKKSKSLSLFRRKSKTPKSYRLPKSVVRACWLEKKTKKPDQSEAHHLLKNFKKRFCVLTNTKLTYYAHIPYDEVGSLNEKERELGGLFLSTLRAVDLSRIGMHKCCVTLRSTTEQLFLSFENVQLQKDWFDTLRDLYKLFEIQRTEELTLENLNSPQSSESSPVFHESLTRQRSAPRVLVKSPTCPPALPGHRRFPTAPPQLFRPTSSPVTSRRSKVISPKNPFSSMLSPSTSRLDLGAFDDSYRREGARPNPFGRDQSKQNVFAQDKPKFKRPIRRAKTAPQADLEFMAEKIRREFAEKMNIGDRGDMTGEVKPVVAAQGRSTHARAVSSMGVPLGGIPIGPPLQGPLPTLKPLVRRRPPPPPRGALPNNTDMNYVDRS